MNLFSIENVYLFSAIVSLVKRTFCYKEGILMETDLFLEISVIKSDFIKRFDCNFNAMR